MRVAVPGSDHGAHKMARFRPWLQKQSPRLSRLGMYRAHQLSTHPTPPRDALVAAGLLVHDTSTNAPRARLPSPAPHTSPHSRFLLTLPFSLPSRRFVHAFLFAQAKTSSATPRRYTPAHCWTVAATGRAPRHGIAVVARNRRPRIARVSGSWKQPRLALWTKCLSPPTVLVPQDPTPRHPPGLDRGLATHQPGPSTALLVTVRERCKQRSKQRGSHTHSDLRTRPARNSHDSPCPSMIDCPHGGLSSIMFAVRSSCTTRLRLSLCSSPCPSQTPYQALSSCSYVRPCPHTRTHTHARTPTHTPAFTPGRMAPAQRQPLLWSLPQLQ